VSYDEGASVTARRIVVLDYGSGNLRSAARAFERAGAQVEVTSDRSAAEQADGLVVPGVGAFAACMSGLREVNGHEIVGRRLAGARPVLGICVGMQVLFDRGIENGIACDGLAEWPGTVDALEAPVIPHMGWNTVAPPADSVLFAGVSSERFYFVHSYAVRSWDMTIDPHFTAPKVTWTTYSEPFVSAVESSALCATQFHPEKSGDAGAAVIENWMGSL
jgi:imidazole glycerol-phosphate synthase subunit HisH